VIKYLLGCAAGHEFESWFRAIDDYDAQARSGVIACPLCGSTAVSKRPMAPAVVTVRGNKAAASQAKSGPDRDHNSDRDSERDTGIASSLRAFRLGVIENSDDVGRAFAGEARKMHFGEIQHRNIRGSSTADEVRDLFEDGVPFGVLPPLPEDLN
jgi:hypothetical protein